MIAIKGNKKENIFLKFQSKNFQNVKDRKNVQAEVIMDKTVLNLVLAVCFVEITNKKLAIFDLFYNFYN